MSRLESRAAEGESPVAVELGMASSSVGLVKPGVNMGGPPSKPKYSSTTDSEPVRRLNDDKHRYKRSERVPETMRLHSGRSPARGDGVPFA